MKRVRLLFYGVVFLGSGSSFAMQGPPPIISDYLAYMNAWGKKDGKEPDFSQAVAVFSPDFKMFWVPWRMPFAQPEECVASREKLVERLRNYKSTYQGWIVRQSDVRKKGRLEWEIASLFCPNTGAAILINAKITLNASGLIMSIVEEARQLSS